MTIVICLILFCSISCAIGSQGNQSNVRTADPWYQTKNTYNIRQIYQWTELEFDYPTPEARDDAINSGDFRSGELTPIDIDVYYGRNGRTLMYITVPRFVPGVPASLGIVNNTTYVGNPIITPYPSWSWHQNVTDCKPDRIVSVFRVKVDECGRLWVLDTGRVEEKVVCPPQILVFDLETDQLINRYEFPYSQYETDSLFVTIIVDVRNATTGCNNAFAYVADCLVPGLLVYDMQRNTSWRLVDSSMYPDPNSGEFEVAGETFEFMDGILGMDLSPYDPSKNRILYYHPLSSLRESKVDTSYLRNPQIGNRRGNFYTYSDLRSSQVAAQAIDENGISYFGLTSAISLNCWNTKTQYGMQNIKTLSQDYTTLQFISGIKIARNNQGQQVLWFLSNRLQRTMAGTLNSNEINFRAQTINVADLKARLVCPPPVEEQFLIA